MKISLSCDDDLQLMQWFADHPEFASNRFYIGGGSYSGLPTVPLVKKVYEGEKLFYIIFSSNCIKTALAFFLFALF